MKATFIEKMLESRQIADSRDSLLRVSTSGLPYVSLCVSRLSALTSTAESGIERLSLRRVYAGCTSIAFQTADLHASDRTLKLPGLSPIQCANCWWRYYSFARTKSKGTPQARYFSNGV